mmetsp:Transcript_35187/g.114953  ORF Transcript_35187/g.114953 Transcript_35187/m.114953 type:complete len:378 (+) Transcript_35187:387-1520(+)
MQHPLHLTPGRRVAARTVPCQQVARFRQRPRAAPPRRAARRVQACGGGGRILHPRAAELEDGPSVWVPDRRQEVGPPGGELSNHARHPLEAGCVAVAEREVHCLRGEVAQAQRHRDQPARTVGEGAAAEQHAGRAQLAAVAQEDAVRGRRRLALRLARRLLRPRGGLRRLLLHRHSRLVDTLKGDARPNAALRRGNLRRNQPARRDVAAAPRLPDARRAGREEEVRVALAQRGGVEKLVRHALRRCVGGAGNEQRRAGRADGEMADLGEELHAALLLDLGVPVDGALSQERPSWVRVGAAGDAALVVVRAERSPLARLASLRLARSDEGDPRARRRAESRVAGSCAADEASADDDERVVCRLALLVDERGGARGFGT